MILPTELFKEYLYILQKYIIPHTIPASWTEGKNGNVILVPGILDDHFFLTKIGNALNKKGYKIHVLKNFRTTYFSIEEIAQILAEYIQKNNLDKIIIVSHSKGSIATRYLMENYSKVNKEIKMVFTISTPHKGTIFAYINVFNFWQLTPSSELINKLLKQKGNLHKITNIYALIDNSVLPNNNLILDECLNIRIDVIGHTRILGDQRTVDVIIKKIDSIKY